jgi:hypothetical protein
LPYIKKGPGKAENLNGGKTLCWGRDFNSRADFQISGDGHRWLRIQGAADTTANVHQDGETPHASFADFGFSVQQPLKFSFRAHVLAHQAGQIC